MKEREINISGAIFHVLRQWRMLVVWMLAGAVLFGVLGYIRDVYRYNAVKEQSTVSDTKEEKSIETEENNIEIEKNDIRKSGGKWRYILIGSITMILFAVCWILWRDYIVGNKLHIEDELDELFHIRQIGVIVSESEKVTGIDAYIIKKRDRNKKRFPVETGSQYIANYIALLAKKKSFTELFIIGNKQEKRSALICRNIVEKLNQKKINAVMVDNLLGDPGDLEIMKSAKYAMLVEMAGVSTYKEILKEKELLHDLGIEILSGIVIE